MPKINKLTKKKQDKLLENVYGLSDIKLFEDIQHRCPLGEQTCLTHFDIWVRPGKILAELVQLHWDIQKMIGQEYTIETALAEVMKIVRSHYVDAKHIEVKASCSTNRHMATEMTVEYWRNEKGALSSY